MRHRRRRRDRNFGHLPGRPGTTSDNFAGRAKKPLHALRLAYAGAAMGSEKVRQTSVIALDRTRRPCQPRSSSGACQPTPPADREASGAPALLARLDGEHPAGGPALDLDRRPLPAARSRPTPSSSWSAPSRSTRRLTMPALPLGSGTRWRAAFIIYAREDSLPSKDARRRVALRARVTRSFRPPTRPASPGVSSRAMCRPSMDARPHIRARPT
jgi:hypothetical protein